MNKPTLSNVTDLPFLEWDTELGCLTILDFDNDKSFCLSRSAWDALCAFHGEVVRREIEKREAVEAELNERGGWDICPEPDQPHDEQLEFPDAGIDPSDEFSTEQPE